MAHISLHADTLQIQCVLWSHTGQAPNLNSAAHKLNDSRNLFNFLESPVKMEILRPNLQAEVTCKGEDVRKYQVKWQEVGMAYSYFFFLDLGRKYRTADKNSNSQKYKITPDHLQSPNSEE